jgi:predicted dehydrogenase
VAPQAPLKLAIVGGRRGKSFARELRAQREVIDVVAVCTRTPETVQRWRDEWAPDYPALRAFTDYARLLEESGCDAVLLATPMTVHAEQSVAALRAGKHVLSEVVAATTMAECWALIEAVRAAPGLTYMLAENYCYVRAMMLVRRMVEAGVFGQPYYAEGAYIHDTRNLGFEPDGTLNWRGQVARDQVGNSYPTHSIGPVAQWLGTTGEGATDRLAELVAWSTPSLAKQRYAARRFGADHPTAQPGFFKGGDSSTTLIRTARGAQIVLRRDSASPRPHNWGQFALQGTAASFLSGRHDDEDSLVWIEGRSPGNSPSDYSRHGQPDSDEAHWERLWDYAPGYEDPLWRAHGDAAQGMGHLGSDYVILRDFAETVLEGRESPIDVYDAVTWSSIVPLSAESVRGGGATVAIPDFRRPG